MCNGNNLPAYVVIKSVDGVGVNKTVSDPQSGLHYFFYFPNILQTIYNLIFFPTFQVEILNLSQHCKHLKTSRLSLKLIKWL